MPFDFYLWLLFPVVALLGVAFFARRKSWVSALWIPALACVAWQSFAVLRVIGANSGSGMEGLGALFALMVGWPWFLLFILGLIAFPRRWTAAPAIAGCLVVVAGLLIIPVATTSPLVIQVLDPEGKPVPKFQCFGISEQVRVKSSQRSYITDANGRFSFRYDPRSTMSFTADSMRGNYGASLTLSDSRKYDNRSVPGLISINAGWRPSGPYQMAQGTAYTGNLDSKEPIPLFIKRLDELVSPALQSQIRDMLHSVRDGKDVSYNELSSACRNAESFDLIDDIAAIIPAQPKCKSAAIQALVQTAEKLHDIHEFTRQFHASQPVAKLGAANSPLFTAICRWAGTEPSVTVGDTMGAINTKIGQYADQLIATSQPYWGDEDSSINVVKALGPLGRPALPGFPAALKDAHPRGRRMILFTLERMHSSVAEVEWAVSSDDPELVAAAYDGVREQIKPEEKALAVERLLRINKPGANTRAQMQVEYLLPAFGYSANP